MAAEGEFARHRCPQGVIHRFFARRIRRLRLFSLLVTEKA
jgi:hypothetical protein